MTITPLILSCPSCGAVITFASNISTLIICDRCGAQLQRNLEGQLLSKPQYSITEKTDILQPGSTGTWNNKKFTIVGRFRAWYEESVFNYWTVVYDDGETTLLAEGYGLYGMLSAAPAELNAKDFNLRSVKIGSQTSLDTKQLFVVNKKLTSFKVEIEGEVYTPGGATSLTELDLTSLTGMHILIFAFDGQDRLAFQIKYSSFQEFRFDNLRPHSFSTRSFSCSQCGALIPTRTWPYGQSYGCLNCGSFHALKDGLEVERLRSQTSDEKIYLPLGTKGEVFGFLYEVIGYAQKEEQNIHKSKWREYTLFNPQEGFAFFSEFDGHWVFLREDCNSPVVDSAKSPTIEINQETFRLFNSYQYQIINARGEFPYNVFDNQNTRANEYISPPEIWISERNQEDGIIWFHGFHISSKKIAEKFSISEMPPRKGIGAVQPKGYINFNKLWKSAFIGVLVLLLIHTLFSLSKKEQMVYQQTISFPIDSTNQVKDSVTLITPKFQLDKWRSNLLFKIHADVVNRWFELDATLVNAETGKEYSFEKGVEYYWGVSEGESWTEGSTEETAYLTSLPAGTYFVQLTGIQEHAYTPLRDFSISIIYDVPSTRNVFWAISLLLILATILYLKNLFYENIRWMNSPYTITES